MVRFKTGFQAFEDFHRLGHGRFHHVHFLEAARERVVFFKNLPVFLVGGRAHAFQLAGRQRRFEQVGGIQRAARSRARTNQCVNFVDEQHGLFLLAQFLDDGFQALLKIATVFGAGQQRAHVQHVDLRVLQDFGHAVFHNHPRQPFGNGRFAHTGFAHQQRVVFAATAQNLDDALNFLIAPDERVNPPLARLFVQILCVQFQRAFALLAFRLSRGFAALFARAQRAARARLTRDRLRAGAGGVLTGFLGRDAVRKIVGHVQPGNVLLAQEKDGVRFLFTKNRRQHVGTIDFLAPGRLRVQHRALNDALKTQRGQCVGIGCLGKTRHMCVDKVGQIAPQTVKIQIAGAQHRRRRGVIQQGQQEVFDGNQFVTLLARVNKRHVQADFKFLGNHSRSSSMTQASGCW